MISLVLPYPPSANRYWRHVGRNVVVSAEAKAYRILVKQHCLLSGVKPIRGDVSASIMVYRPRKIGDLDNTQKVLLDALCGAAYDDDRQIVELHAWRRDSKEDPRVEVDLRESGEP